MHFCQLYLLHQGTLYYNNADVFIPQTPMVLKARILLLVPEAKQSYKPATF